MTEEGSAGPSRRSFMRAVAGAAGAAAVADSAAALQDGAGDFDGWLSDVDNYDGEVVDRTDSDPAVVGVGAEGNGGTFAFAPPAIRITSGTQVTFRWTSNTHNVVVEEQPGGASWGGHEAIENEGFEYNHTFQTEGIYKYFCQPHIGQGMKGVIVVGEVDIGGGGTETPGGGDDGTETETPDGGEDGTETPDGDGGDGGGGGGNTWTVEMTDENVFDPGTIEVRPGDTVVWENVGSTPHSVTAYGEEIPDGAEYWASGGAGSEDEARNVYPDQGEIGGGGTYEHTFQTEGSHGYFCIPHEQLGMTGSVEVSQDAPTPSPTPEPADPALPPTAKALGVGAAAAMASTLGLAYAFIKYGGGGPSEE